MTTMTNRGRRLCEASGVSRREALKIGARGIALGLAGAVSPLPPLFGAASKAIAATEGKILVVFEWFGGYDGLSTFVPYSNDALYRHRPNLGVREGRRSQGRRALRLPEVDARHAPPLERRQRGRRARRGLRPALVLALHVRLVLAHRRPQQRRRVRLVRPHRRCPRPVGDAQLPRQHLVDPEPRGAGPAARPGRLRPAVRVHPGRLPPRAAVRRPPRDGAGGAHRRPQVPARRQPERPRRLRPRQSGLGQLQPHPQPRPAAARPRQGRGVDRERLPGPALLRPAAGQPVRHPRQPGEPAQPAGAVTARTRSGPSSRR